MHRRTLVLAAIVWAAATASAQPLKFDFGSGPPRASWTRVTLAVMGKRMLIGPS